MTSGYEPHEMMRVPISAPVRPRQAWPRGPSPYVHEYVEHESEIARALWGQYFDVDYVRGDPPPSVYWSSRLGPNADAVTYDWGICLSRRAYRRVAQSRRSRWLVNVLKHELIHWSGVEGHTGLFRTYLKRIGGTV